VPKADLSLNGLVGVMEAMLEAAKRFQEFEEHYQANEASFQQIQQQFQQMQDHAAQMQALAEERLTALSSLNVELKARYSQGDQTLAEVRALLEEAKAAQTRIEQIASAAEGRGQVESERSTQLAQTLSVVQTLVDKLQTRQAQMEQSLMAIEALIQDQGKRQGHSGEITRRQDHLERTLATLETTQQAEKSLIAHFEKTVSALKSRLAELEKRPAIVAGAPGAEAAAVGELTARIEELCQSVQQSAEQAARAQELSTQALEKAQAASAATGGPAEDGAAVASSPAGEAVRQFLARCEEDYKAALERESKLAGQWRKTLDSLPARADGAIQRFLEQNQARIEQSFNAWLQQHDQRTAELEKREGGLINRIIEKQRQMEGEVSRLAAGGNSPTFSAEWSQAIQAASASHTNELRFLRMLLWITLAAVGLSYGLVAYAVILRS